MLELVGRMLPEGDPHPGTFDLLHNALSRLGQVDSLPAAVLAYFQYRLLRQVGLLGDLLTCTSCGQRVEDARRGAVGQAYFSSREGGLICPDCTAPPTEKYALDADTLTGLGVLQAPRRTTGGRATFPESQARAVNRLLAYHVAEQLGKPLRTSRYAID
jgi:DNA repair protein RecO